MLNEHDDAAGDAAQDLSAARCLRRRPEAAERVEDRKTAVAVLVDVALRGPAFIALQALQTIGRLFADHVVTRFGDRAVARAGATMAGLAIADAYGLRIGLALIPIATATVILAATLHNRDSTARPTRAHANG